IHTSHAGKFRPGKIKAVVPALVAGTHLIRPLIESSARSFHAAGGDETSYDLAPRRRQWAPGARCHGGGRPRRPAAFRLSKSRRKAGSEAGTFRLANHTA